MLSFVAPAGAPVAISEIMRSAAAATFGRGERDGNLQILAERLKVGHAFGAASGRSALAVILRSLSRLRPDRRTVALPAYTCFTVPAAVVRAGLRILPVEIDPVTLDFNFEGLNRLPGESLLCIVSSNLFGLANNAPCIHAAARARGAFFIDDAAQALGATLHGFPAGTLGDVGFYSFGRGKALTAVEGALIVTNSDEIAAAIREEAEKLPSGSMFHSAKLLFQMLVYSAFLRPRLYWVPNALPFLKLGSTEFDPAFPEFRMPALVQGLLPRLMDKLDEFNRIRRQNALALTKALEGNATFAVPKPRADCLPNYIRFPLIARDNAARDRTVRELRARGIGASPFYPSAVCDIEGIAPHMAVRDFHRPKAEEVSRRLLTLPTHPYVTKGDLETMVNTLRKVKPE
jgi:dTDP-4-amino-4,6-dideoxygalactose transaminase